MKLVGTTLTTLAKLLGPRWEWRLALARKRRWAQLEAEWYLLEHLCHRSWTAVDIGANEGVWAGRLAALCRQVHAFEPVPGLAGELRRKLPRNVVVHEIALSDSGGETTLRIPTRDGEEDYQAASIDAQALFGTYEKSPENPLRFKDLLVTKRTLDSYNFDAVHFIKVDVEAHELAVLNGAVNTIQKSKPVVIVESEKRHHPDAPENVFQFFERLSYSGYFCYDGDIISVKDFPASQREHDRGEYVFNFLFFPTPLREGIRRKLKWALADLRERRARIEASRGRRV